MDPLVLQLLLRQLENEGSLGGPGAQIGPSGSSGFGVPNELGILPSAPSKPRGPLGGPNAKIGPPPSNPAQIGGYPNELGLMGGSAPAAPPAARTVPAGRGPTNIGPGSTSGFGVPNEMGVVGSTEAGMPPVPVPPMDLPAPMQPIPAAYASELMGPPVTAPAGGVRPQGELPFETFQRLTGQKWTGGGSSAVLDMMRRLGVEGQPGSAQANLALQKALLANAGNIQG